MGLFGVVQCYMLQTLGLLQTRQKEDGDIDLRGHLHEPELQQYWILIFRTFEHSQRYIHNETRESPREAPWQKCPQSSCCNSSVGHVPFSDIFLGTTKVTQHLISALDNSTYHVLPQLQTLCPIPRCLYTWLCPWCAFSLCQGIQLWGPQFN